MPQRILSNIIGFDDSPFPPDFQGKVKVVGTVFASLRLDGVLIGEIMRDGSDAAEELERIISRSKFREHVQLIMLQGIALGGFNVVDVFCLHEGLSLPVMVVSRKLPQIEAIRRALLFHIPGGQRKWALIEKLGPMEPVGGVYIQRVGLTLEEAASVVQRFSVHGRIPEPLRTAHLIAGALTDGQSRGNP